MRLVNHPFRLDSQRLLSYLTSMRVLTLAVTPAISTTFWNTIYFYAASATAGNLSYDCARGRHCTVSAAASRRHVDAFLDLFTRESPRLERFIREESSQRAPPFFVDIGGLECCRLLVLGIGWREALPWRPSTPRHSSRSLPSGSAIRCHSSLRCAGAHDSGFVGRASSMWLLGRAGDSFVLLPRILGCWGSFTRAFLLGRLVI